jgi:hypothetical protein
MQHRRCDRHAVIELGAKQRFLLGVVGGMNNCGHRRPAAGCTVSNLGL